MMKYILVHGLGQTNRSWEAVQKKLCVTAECPELYSLMKQSAAYQSLYREFANWCNSFEEPLHLCGLSLGGVLVLDYAGHFPERVKSLVLIGTPYRLPKLAFTFQRVVFRVMPEKAFAGMGISKREALSLTDSMRRLDIAGMAEQIACKTLILCGEKDGTNKKSAELLKRAVKDSRLLWIEGAAHEVNADNPGRLAEMLNEFWREG